MVSCGADSLIKLWDLQTGLCTQTLSKHGDYVECLAYSSQSDLLCSAGLSNSLQLWKLDSLYPTPTECLSLTQHSGEQCGSIYSLHMAASGSTLCTGGTDRVVRCWDTRSCLPVLKLLGHADNIRGVRLHDDGHHCVSVSADNCCRLWDMRKQRCTATYQLRPGSSSAAAASSFSSAFAGGLKTATYSMAVNSTFSKLYTAHSTGLVAVCDLSSGRVEPLLSLPSPVITARLDESRHRLWCGSFDSGISCWDVRPTLVRHSSFDTDDAEEEEDGSAEGSDGQSASPLLTRPVYELDGCPPLKRVKVTGDGWHALTCNSAGSVQLWDVVSQRMMKDYGQQSFDELLQRKNAALLPSPSSSSSHPQQQMPAWFTCDVRLGCLCVTLDRRTAWSAQYVIVPPPLPDAEADRPDDVVVNLGESAVRGLFAEWAGLERLALLMQQGIGVDEDGIEEREEEQLMFSPLLSPQRAVSSNAPARPPAAASSSSPSIVAVQTSVIISFPRSQRRTPLYLSIPVPALPLSLAPHLPFSSPEQAKEAAQEEALLELDRRRAVYYQTVPDWVEERVMAETELRAQRPAEDLLPDPFVNVREWAGFGDEEGEGEEEAAEEDEDEDEAELELSDASSRREDSLSRGPLQASEPIGINRSPASVNRSRLSRIRNSLSSRSGGVAASPHSDRSRLRRTHSPSRSPASLSSFLTLQHPSIPKNGSHGSLLMIGSSPVLRGQHGHEARQSSHSPLDSSFDLNAMTHRAVSAALDGSRAVDRQRSASNSSEGQAADKVQFQLLPFRFPSASSSSDASSDSPNSSLPSSRSLPAVLHGSLLVPSSMTVLRIKQYLCKKVNNSPAFARADAEELREDALELLSADERSLDDALSFEQLRLQQGGSEKSLRIYYRRKATTIPANSSSDADKQQRASAAAQQQQQANGHRAVGID